jgi:hypothetical protein
MVAAVHSICLRMTTAALWQAGVCREEVCLAAGPCYAVQGILHGRSLDRVWVCAHVVEGKEFMHVAMELCIAAPCAACADAPCSAGSAGMKCFWGSCCT